jgi:hypothetical protein
MDAAVDDTPRAFSKPQIGDLTSEQETPAVDFSSNINHRGNNETVVTASAPVSIGTTYVRNKMQVLGTDAFQARSASSARHGSERRKADDAAVTSV